jgi:hypothetical protein
MHNWQPSTHTHTRLLHKLFTGGAIVALRTAIMLDFICNDYGAAYGVTPYARARLVYQSRRTVRAIPSGTSVITHLVLMREILSIPPTTPGVVVECGVWKGASSASLSLACRLTGRRLLVCDSFAGLPATGQTAAGSHLYLAPHAGLYGYLTGGMFSGALTEVQQNIARFGALDVCDFVPGFFADSLPQVQQPIAFAFLDVDLPASFHDCLRHLWPQLVNDGVIYVDDVGCLDLCQIFFDEAWWQQELGCPAPGLVGAGCGLPLHPVYSNIGYTRKLPANAIKEASRRWRQAPYLVYPTASTVPPDRQESP